MKKLGEVIIKTETTNPKDNPLERFCYVDVSSVDNNTFSIANYSTIIGKDAPSRARKLIKEKDVIFATVRPTLKRIAIVPDYLDGQICSTGYIVLRVAKDISYKFLYYFLQTDGFIETIRAKEKGASYPAVTESDVKECLIPVPTIAEQQRIVDILDSEFEKIEQLKENATQSLTNAQALFQATLKLELNSEQIQTVAMRDLFNIKTGKLNANAAVEDGEYPFFTCSREIYKIDNFAFDCEAILLAGNNASGDFNVKHYCGKFNAYQRTYVITAKKENVECRLLYYVLEGYLSKLKAMSIGANTKFLKLGMIENIEFPNVSHCKQVDIVLKLDALVECNKQLEQNYKGVLDECGNLKQAILKQAFNGNL